MPYLNVPGANLYYETFGSGRPLLVLIPGAQGTGSIFHAIAGPLSAYFTVVCWDRRGYSQSHLVGSQDLEQRLQIDADDAHQLIAHISPDAPAYVFGTSSGALVAQQLLASHPESVAKLVAHEPPAFSVLPDEHRMQAQGLIEHIYTTYRTRGCETAMEVFASALAEGLDADSMRHAMDAKRGADVRANCLFWFEFELRQYTRAAVDLEGLRKSREKLVLAAGEGSGDGPGVGPMRVIGGHLQKDIVKIPGGHLGYDTDVKKFASRLVELLQVQ